MSRFHIRLSRRASTYAGFSDCLVALNLKRRLSVLSLSLVSIALFGLAMSFASQASAATKQVKYLDITGTALSGQQQGNSAICPGSGSNLNICILPGYGRVHITWIKTGSNPVPYINPMDAAAAHGGTSIQPIGWPDAYHWNADTKFIDMFNSQSYSANWSDDYDVTFEFLDGIPNLTKLFLVTVGLGAKSSDYTTANFSGQGQLVGSFPMSNTAATKIVATSSDVTLSNSSSTLPTMGNTDWSLFQFTSSFDLTGTNPNLVVHVHRSLDDGIGVTLGYIQDEGVLKVCKVAGSDDMVGKQFEFSDDQGINRFTVPAGPAPGGYCVVAPNTYAIGSTVLLSETIPPGYKVTDTTVAPSDRISDTNLNHGKDLNHGTVAVKIGTGVTEVTYTDEKIKMGYLEICKQGDVSGNFTFTIDGVDGTFTVPANACSPAIQVPSGDVVIREKNVPAVVSWPLHGCSTIPADRQGRCDSRRHASIVAVNEGDISSQTIAYITNN